MLCCWVKDLNLKIFKWYPPQILDRLWTTKSGDLGFGNEANDSISTKEKLTEKHFQFDLLRTVITGFNPE